MAIALVIVGIACILYGFLVMSIASGTWFFAFWFVVGALFLGGAWAIHAGLWNAIPLAGRRVIGVVIGVLVVSFLATQVLILKDFGDKGEDGLDYIIVLGAQVREDGPSVVLQHRLDTAYDYLQKNPDTLCVVSGGQAPNEPATEASVMAAYLIERGISPERIIVEDRSTNTRENIAFSKELIDESNTRVGIVTNNFHVFRGLNIARKGGFAHVVGIAAPSNPLFLPNNMTRESLSIAKDTLTGNL